MLLTEVQNELKDVWNDVSPQDKKLLEEVAKYSAKVLARAVMEGPDIFEAEQKHIQAQLLNISAPYAPRVQEAFWQSLSKVAATVAKTIVLAVI